MTAPLRNPTQLAGSPALSGDCGTRELRWTQGGERVFTSFSGSVADALIFSGGGRLNNAIPIGSLVSGKPVIFYDAAVATSGGPFSASGHKILGLIPAAWHPGASGVINPLSQPGQVVNIGMPFSSGLCVAPGGAGSGTVSFTCSYTPDATSAASGSVML